MAESAQALGVEVVYARPEQQVLVALRLRAPVTARQAIEDSGILARFPEIDLARQTVGIFSQPVALEQPLRDGDRVEIYRPLQVDPKQMRRQRAGGERG